MAMDHESMGLMRGDLCRLLLLLPAHACASRGYVIWSGVHILWTTFFFLIVL